ncbi:MAG: SDR family oxidoreductase [Fulvivirga sp.]|nr:SDR family oxidoreductase [Fulvivirga sp.]
MKSALILGATSDVSKALAQLLASEGYRLTLAARNTDKLTAIKSDLEIKYKVSVDLALFDAEDFASHEQFVKNLKELPPITICVFGYLGDHDLAKENWVEAKRIIDTNYTGAVSILNLIANRYEANNEGVIVGVSSVAGERGRQSNYFYGSAKAAFTAFLSGLRNRLFHQQVHVVTVKPGFIATKMTEDMDLPKPLTATPEQVAKAMWKACKHKKNTIYVLGRWRLIMYIIKSIPEFIFKRLKL